MSKTKNINNSNLFITNDDLKGHIHNIHNYIRNNGLGYGKRALEIFNFLYGLKLIESKLDLLGISKNDKEIIKFSNILKQAKIREYHLEGKPTTEKINDALTIIESLKYKELYKYILYDVPTTKQGIKEIVWITLLKLIDDIPVGYEQNKVNLSGKVYEYFIGRDQTAISELGAYFSDRHITSFCFNKVKPILNENNTVKSMIDMFGGSGGFTLGYVSYLIEKYNNIDWKENINNIYHCDMESSVVHMTGLEMFALTNYFPKIEAKTFITTNTFTWEFAGCNNDYMKWFYIFTNPPYGGDKISKNAEQIKRDKIISKIKSINSDERSDKLNEQLKYLVKQNNNYKKEQEIQQVNLETCSKRIKNFAKKYNIDNANDKEACSLILLMDCLDEGGICCAILKEGVYFNNVYSDIRKVLIENFNVTNVISVPQNAFENTSTKTSIIIFHNTGKTQKITFSELEVILEPEDIIELGVDGWFHMINNKDEIKEVIDKQICSATYEQLIKPTIIVSKGKKAEKKERFDYSLNYKDYKDFKVVCPDGYEIKQLGDIINFNSKAKRLANFADNNGIFRYYSSGNKILKCSEADFNNELSIIIGHSGNGCLFIDDTFSTLITNHILQSKDKLLLCYIYNYLTKYWNIFYEQCYKGSTVKNTSNAEISNFQLPIPKDLSKLKKPLSSLQILHQQITNDTELIPQKEKFICNLIKKLSDEGKEGIDYDKYKLEDICEINPSNNKIISEYINYLDISGCNIVEIPSSIGELKNLEYLNKFQLTYK